MYLKIFKNYKFLNAIYCQNIYENIFVLLKNLKIKFYLRDFKEISNKQSLNELRK
jgi:hypothetical protein